MIRVIRRVAAKTLTYRIVKKVCPRDPVSPVHPSNCEGCMTLLLVPPRNAQPNVRCDVESSIQTGDPGWQNPVLPWGCMIENREIPSRLEKVVCSKALPPRRVVDSLLMTKESRSRMQIRRRHLQFFTVLGYRLRVCHASEHARTPIRQAPEAPHSLKVKIESSLRQEDPHRYITSLLL